MKLRSRVRDLVRCNASSRVLGPAEIGVGIRRSCEVGYQFLEPINAVV